MNDTNIPLDLDRLESLALAATPGPWQWTATKPMTISEQVDYLAQHLSHGQHGPLHGVGCPNHPLTVLGEDPMRPETMVEAATTGNGPNSESNAQFIAALSPDVVLALVARVRDAERSRLALQDRFDRDGVRLVRQDDELRKLRAVADAARDHAATMNWTAPCDWNLGGPCGHAECRVMQALAALDGEQNP